MKRTYRFVMRDGTVRYVDGKGRQSACMRLTGYRVKPAMDRGIIRSVEAITAMAWE